MPSNRNFKIANIFCVHTPTKKKRQSIFFMESKKKTAAEKNRVNSCDASGTQWLKLIILLLFSGDDMQCTVSVGTRYVDRQWSNTRSNRKNSILAVIIIPGVIGVALLVITIWWPLTKRRNGL